MLRLAAVGTKIAVVVLVAFLNVSRGRPGTRVFILPTYPTRDGRQFVACRAQSACFEDRQVFRLGLFGHVLIICIN